MYRRAVAVIGVLCLALQGCAGPGLAVHVVGTGNGSVSEQGGLFSCSGDCTNYDAAGSVTLVQQPASAQDVFGGWTGECTVSAQQECRVNLDAPREVVAAFYNPAPPAGPFALVVNRTGAGVVHNLAAPSDPCPGSCGGPFPGGTLATLQATPDTLVEGATSQFTGWRGCDALLSGNTRCLISMHTDRTVDAEFATTFRLRVVRTGSGVVQEDVDGGIDCGALCARSIASGTDVRLSASAQTGSQLAAWGGACSGTDRTSDCVVRMDQPREVEAEFKPNSEFTFKLTLKALGHGTVQVRKKFPGAAPVVGWPIVLSCPYTAADPCSIDIQGGTGIFIEAIPDVGSHRDGWSGACGGYHALQPCELTMDGDISATMQFRSN
jgi:hypothetical protein